MIFYNILKNTWSNIASNVHTFLQLKTSLHPCPSPLVLRACACTPLLQSLPHHKLQYWHLLWFLLSADILVFDSLQDWGRRECSSGDLPSWVGLIYSSLKQTMPALTPHNFSLLPGFWISFLVNSPWPLILSHGQNSTQDDLVQLPPPGTHHLTSCTQTTLPALSPRVEASTKSRPSTLLPQVACWPLAGDRRFFKMCLTPVLHTSENTYQVLQVILLDSWGEGEFFCHPSCESCEIFGKVSFSKESTTPGSSAAQLILCLLFI